MLKKLFKLPCMKDDKCKHHANNPVYAFGLFGSLIYFWQSSDPGFMEKVYAILKALFWPGVVVYELLKFIAQ